VSLLAPLGQGTDAAVALFGQAQEWLWPVEQWLGVKRLLGAA
jgi:hypothetical protein